MANFLREPISIFEQFPLVPYGCLQKGIERKFGYLSPLIEKFLGYPASYFLDDSRAFFGIIHEDDRNMYLRMWEESVPTRAKAQEVQLEYRVRSQLGQAIRIQEYGLISQVGPENERDCQGFLLFAQEDNPVMLELGRWDRELRGLTESLPDWVARVDRRFRMLYLNRDWESQLPSAPEQYIGKSIHELGFFPGLSHVVSENLNRIFTESSPRSFEISHSLDQKMKFFEFRLFPEKNDYGETITVLIICRDVTDARASQLAFKESEEKFRQLAETVDSVFWIWDVFRQQVAYVSPAYERLWGGDAQRLMRNPFDWLTLVVPEDRSRVEDSFFRRLDHESLDIEYRILSREKHVRWIHHRTFPMIGGRNEQGQIIGLAQDVTERKHWEEERLRNAKLESLGLLAGGLAHDFNNLLTAILGQVALAKYGLDSNHPVYYRLTEAENASIRAQDIARQLLTFSKGGDPIKKVLSLRPLIEETVRLVVSGSNVRPVFDIPETLDPVNADAGQICQVLHNLVINACQAMLNGGDCMVSAYNVSGDWRKTEEAEGWGQENDRWVRIDIADQGIGIPEDQLVKIFDPYFTTKSTGSGLGLATSYSIIRNHGGKLFVTSEVNKGSTFSILLPASHVSKMENPPADLHLKKGDGEILIMDDEVQVRRILGEMVETCGYRCQTAKDGHEALQLYAQAQKKDTPFSAVILDLTVPGGMGGKEVIQELRKLDPEVKAIVVSGYSNDPVLANYEAYGFKGRVAKPFSLLELSLALNGVLENRPS